MANVKNIEVLMIDGGRKTPKGFVYNIVGDDEKLYRVWSPSELEEGDEILISKSDDSNMWFETSIDGQARIKEVKLKFKKLKKSKKTVED